ncbi:MAG: class E sortase, partial [Actinomycetota bacterium]
MFLRAVRATGELLITAGLVVFLFVAYELWGTGVHTAHAQHAAEGKLAAAWQAGVALPGEEFGSDDPVVASGTPTADPGSSGSSGQPGKPGQPSSAATPTPAGQGSRTPVPDIPLGTGLAKLWIPRFGSGYQWVIGEGVTHENLKDGPGHYPHTAFPGQVGNFVVSGHRTTYGAPFGGIAELLPGDAIVVETAKNWYTYRVRSHDIVDPTQVGVTLPVPDRPGAAPT